MTGLWDYRRLSQVERMTMYIVDRCGPSPEMMELCKGITKDEDIPEHLAVHAYDHDHHEDTDWVI